MGVRINLQFTRETEEALKRRLEESNRVFLKAHEKLMGSVEFDKTPEYVDGTQKLSAILIESKNNVNDPPAFGEVLLHLFVREKYRDSLSITLSEEFERRLEHGCSLQRAQRLYWTSVVRALGPQFSAFMRRHGYQTLKYLGLAGLLEEFVRRFTH